MEPSKNHVCIIGGGIAGLSAAWHLKRSSSNFHITLLEETSRLGGKILTERSHDFLIEGGPDSILSQKPEAYKLCEELGLSNQFLSMSNHKVYVYHDQQFAPIPSGFRLLVPTDTDAFLQSSLFSEEGKKRILEEKNIPAKSGSTDESIADFIRRRFGGECLERIGAPLLAGIHVGDPEKLSIQSTFPQLVALEKNYGSLIQGMQETQRTRNSKKAIVQEIAKNGISEPNGPMSTTGGRENGPFISLNHGLSQLIKALASNLSESIIMNSGIYKITFNGKDYSIFLDRKECIQCDAVLCAIPANHASRIIENLNPALAQNLKKIRFASSATLSLGFDKKKFEEETNFDGFGFIIAQKEKRKILSASISSRKFKHRAPEDKVLLRVFLGGHANESILEKTNDSLLKLTREELKIVLGLSCSPIFSRVYRWDKANPQYEIGHREHVQRIEDLASHHPHFYLIGSSYHGVGISDCIANSKKIVKKLIAEMN